MGIFGLLTFKSLKTTLFKGIDPIQKSISNLRYAINLILFSSIAAEKNIRVLESLEQAQPDKIKRKITD